MGLLVAELEAVARATAQHSTILDQLWKRRPWAIITLASPHAFACSACSAIHLLLLQHVCIDSMCTHPAASRRGLRAGPWLSSEDMKVSTRADPGVACTSASSESKSYSDVELMIRRDCGVLPSCILQRHSRFQLHSYTCVGEPEDLRKRGMQRPPDIQGYAWTRLRRLGGSLCWFLL